MEREVGGEIGMGNTCKPMAVSFQCMTKSTTKKKKKRHLLLGRKAVRKLDSVLKSRDISLLTKVHLVKFIVSPVVMFGCESWTIKKTECQRIDALEL